MISVASAMHFFFSSNEKIFQKSIAFERLFTKTKCSSATISTLSHTQSHPTMSNCAKISFRLILMCSRFLLTKAALVIL